MRKRIPQIRKNHTLAILWVLYAVQGLPFGFQVTALPIYLRAHGVSLAAIGFAGALAVPWMLKAFWAPAVDRFFWARFGRRRSWIVPMQAALALAALAAAFAPAGDPRPILVLVFAMNLCAATMDIAVDGLALDLLEPEELGRGNIAQVVGYKVGMLTGGGLLVWASGRIGWTGLFAAMAGLVALALLVTLAFREPPPTGRPERTAPESVRAILATLVRALRLPGAGWLLVFIATYKLGEAMADAMFKPFLYDAGFGRAQIGLWVGTWGMLFSLGGSFGGGWLAGRSSLLRAVGLCAALRAVAVAGEWWLTAWGTPAASAVIGVTAFEHLTGGALTTAMFAFMMSRTDRRIGATHYTVLATVEVLGKSPASWASGVLAERLGYSGLFALATVLSLLFMALLPPLRRSRDAAVKEVTGDNPA